MVNISQIMQDENYNHVKLEAEKMLDAFRSQDAAGIIASQKAIKKHARSIALAAGEDITEESINKLGQEIVKFVMRMVENG